MWREAMWFRADWIQSGRGSIPCTSPNKKIIDKVYIIIGSSGQYDDYRTHIMGIYKNAIDAESECRKINDKHKEILDTPCPVANWNNDNPVDEDYNTLTNEQKESLCNWQILKYESEEFNGAKVKEYELK